MSAWKPNLYLQFANERTQPSIDLVSRVNVDRPRRVVDLGCGPGNSTEIVRQRWPEAQVAGLDNSPEMLAVAREKYPDQQWILADAASWQAEAPVDVVFSNAALQWVPDHARLMPHLFAQVAPGGALAFQIPSRLYSPTHQLIVEVACEAEWRTHTAAAREAFTMEHPDFYYDVLAGDAARVDMWETEYYHVMADAHAIMAWITGAALRPFVDALPDDEARERFVERVTERVVAAYPPRRNGRVLFPFRRLFVVAYR
jgi:trans-aconitate 2-methyltransferase